MTAPSNLQDELVRLTQVLLGEGARLMGTFAAQQGLHPTDVAALTRIIVAEQQGALITAGALAEELTLTSGAVTSVVDRLERAGYVARVRDKQDRRRVLLQHSAAGRALADEFLVPFAQREEVAVDQFTPTELDVVRRYLEAAVSDMAAYRLVLQQRSPATRTTTREPDQTNPVQRDANVDVLDVVLPGTGHRAP